ncbi:MAG: hypothetical protein H7843_03230 [Nitrospirota bacterium]
MDNFFLNILYGPATVMNGVFASWAIFAACAVGFYMLLRYAGSSGISAGVRTLVFVTASGLMAVYVVELYLYLTSYAYGDHVEPGIAAVSWIFTKGRPVYPPLDSHDRYSFVYGPALFIINGYIMKAFGASILTSKLGGVMAAILAVVFSFLSFRKLSGNQAAFITAALIILIFMDFPVVTFWQRADPFIIFFVVLALYASTGGSKTAAVIVAGICTGICADLKLHSVLYFIPVAAVLYVRFGLAWGIGMYGLGFIMALAPFVIFKNISLYNYAMWMRATARHGLELTLFIKNLNFIALKIAAASLIYLYGFKDAVKLRRHMSVIWAFLASSLAVSVVASKPGAGVHHLLPLIPVMIYLFLASASTVNIDPSQKNIFIAILISSLIVTAMPAIKTPIILYMNIKERAAAPEIFTEVEGIIAAYPSQTIEMGYAGDDTYTLTYYRPLFVFHTGIYSFDAASLMDNVLSGISIPEAAIRSISDCRTGMWVMPRGAQAFSMNGYDKSSGGLFTSTFQSTFIQRYKIVSSTRHFDVWSCVP